MFWRKKKTDRLEVELAEPDSTAAERREAFRIGSDPEHPVLVTIAGVEYQAANISAGGLAVRSRELQAGRKYSIRLQLPHGSPVILTELQVVRITAQGLCRCKFITLSALSRDALHRYILGREKDAIRMTKTRRALTTEHE